jgi:EAL domain-containing protein (putative c-di-GMP-specific phosphodiesterase class I)
MVTCPFLSQQTATNVKRSVILRAIQDREFEFFFQPQLDINLRIVQSEALLRWNHNGEVIPPSEFIPFAEQDKHGLIKDIGREVLRLTTEVLPRWKNLPALHGLPLAINISPKELCVDFFDHLQKLITEEIILSHQFLLEITEAHLEEDKEDEVSTILERIDAELKIKLSLDDFGTDGSSILRFSKHPYSEIKYDRALIRNLNHVNPRVRERTKDSIQSIAAQAQAYGCTVVQEGIQTSKEFQSLQELGISNYQGFFFYKPMNEYNFIALLTAQAAAS